jgi:hypothetical protein
MATRKTFEIRSRSRRETKAAAVRLSKFLERSESNLVEILILNSERAQLKRMTPEERAKYFAGKLTFTDAIKIRLAGIHRVTAPPGRRRQPVLRLSTSKPLMRRAARKKVPHDLPCHAHQKATGGSG